MAKSKRIETADAKDTMEAPEREIARHPDTSIAVKTDSVIVFQARRKLEEHEYELLSRWIRKENADSGLKIVLAPYSVDAKVGGADGYNR